MLDSTRKGEIAHLLLKEKLMREGVRIGDGLRFEIGQASVNTKIPSADILSYAQVLMQEILDETLRAGEPLTQNELDGHGHPGGGFLGHGHGGH